MRGDKYQYYQPSPCPLLGAGVDGRYDSVAGMKPPFPPPALPSSSTKSNDRRSSKCLVYILVLVVLLGAFMIVFGRVVMRLKPIKAELRSADVKSVRYSAMYPPQKWNATVTARFSIRNHNFGRFEYGRLSAAVTNLEEGVRLGDLKIAKGRVEARGTAVISATVSVNSNRMGTQGEAVMRSSGDYNSGRLRMSTRLVLKGKVHLVEIMKMSSSAVLICTMTLDFQTQQIQDLFCQ